VGFRVGRVEQNDGFVRSSCIKQIGSAAAKLRRMFTKLSGVEDIAGCRVIVPSPDDIDRLLVECMTLRVSRVRDYYRVRSHGYRAMHLVVRAADERPVELQLSTLVQHAWANLVESFASIVDSELKYGGGPAQERCLLDQFSTWGRHVDLSLHRLAIDKVHTEADKAMQRVKADTLAVPVEIGLPRGQPAERLMEEVARFTRLCESL